MANGEPNGNDAKEKPLQELPKAVDQETGRLEDRQEVATTVSGCVCRNELYHTNVPCGQPVMRGTNFCSNCGPPNYHQHGGPLSDLKMH